MSFFRGFRRIGYTTLFLLGFSSFQKGIAQQTHFIDEEKVADTLSKGAMAYRINDSDVYVYGRQKPFSFLVHSAQDLYIGPKYAFRKSNLVTLAGITAATLTLIVFDQGIIDVTQKFGKYIGLSGSIDQKSISPVSSVPILVPTSFSTGLYYLGDGITEIAVNGSFFVYGLITKDKRALTTASELSEGLIDMTIATQVLKHITGRQCPYTRTKPRGKWNWFPNQIKYSKAVPHYDAFPSGHLANAMMTVTIIAQNYPEKWFVRPIGYTIMGLCGFEMLNNGVHWASDYPLAIAMGYSFAKIAVSRNRLKVLKSSHSLSSRRNEWMNSIKFSPTIMETGTPGLSLSMKF
jgi:hypothetical protein